MAVIKTCLLVSDDPDDHQIFYEALRDTSEGVAMIIVLDGNDALMMLQREIIRPNVIVVDIDMDSTGVTFIHGIIESRINHSMSTLMFTDQSVELADNAINITQLNKGLTYSEICRSLKHVISPKQ
jgi:CheY-like chemotaxis protein